MPIIVLALGAGLLAASAAASRAAYKLLGLVPVVAALLAAMSALLLGLRLPAEALLSAWKPDPLFQTGLVLRADWISWMFMMALLLAALAAFLTELARTGGPRLGPRIAGLLITAAALGAIQADNLITLVVSWALLDVIYFVSLVVLARAEGIETQAVLSLGFNSAGTFFAVAAALDTIHSGQVGLFIGQSKLTDQAGLLLFLAVIFRLGVFPFHLGLPVESNIRQGLGALLRLAPAAAALDLLTHIVSLSPDIPLKLWLSAAAAIGLLAGAAQWWDSSDPRPGLNFVVMAQSSLAVLAALWGGPMAAPATLAFGLALVLGGAALFLNNGFDGNQPVWVVAPLLGSLTLAGAPLTIGYLASSVLYLGLADSGQWLLFIAGLIGQMLLAASYLRLAFWPGEELPKGEPIIGVAYLFGLASPLLFAVIGGLAVGAIGEALAAPVPDVFSADSLIALGAVLVTIIGGVGLWFASQQDLIRARAASAWGVMTSTARLDWLYAALWSAYRFAGRTLRTAAAIIEGEGGVLWTLVVALLLWLLVRSR